MLAVGGVSLPRLVYGLGSLMKWAPNHAYPLPTDSSREVQLALAARFRHFNTGDLYTNNESAARCLRESGLKRSELFLSLKINTYAILGCTGRQHMVDSIKREIERFNLDGYVDLLQLHFPPRGYKDNLSNREAWRVLEDMKSQGLARVIGVSNWTLSDYEDIMEAPDLKFAPQIHEFEFNPFLFFDPEHRALRQYEEQHGIINMNYGLLTPVTGRLPKANESQLLQTLDQLSRETKLEPATILLKWGYDRLGGFIVTSTSNADRMASVTRHLSESSIPLLPQQYDAIEQAAKADGPEGKKFYGHFHMEAAAKR